ncbi:hypothetical protein CYJ46_11405 [Corynebacterium coyleae]|uniref:bifunctional glycosyltransferase/CDP-glycerol:glycerophosphate glycerophosphotransferase n=1 Tax=Corynebacterium coyleae TaxID=53374 RepID=UPI000C78EEFD|nr:CDP-glycerol glycerophosphotransferase family protein [Corynebacterium coyleae]PLA36907.1 hypothetical protein CYJ46_11405 [Corynebacterium coyleae]
MGLGKFRPVVSYAHDVRAWLKQLPNAKQWVHRGGIDEQPKLSVIVPCHNAARWVATLIHSIQSQGVDSMEIIVVDDKSTDATRSIVHSLQLLDRRIRILGGEGRGPGAARNMAIEQAHGEFLAFADADDLVLPGAYRSMLQTLEETGSDFVFGGYVRHKGSSVTRPQIVEATHSRDVLRANASDFPEALNEPVLWNKIFRMEFWRSSVRAMPEHLNYEDQPPILRAIVSATSFDVLKRDVYSWRLSDEGMSRSNAKADIDDLRDRVAITRMMWSEAVERNAPDELRKFMLERFISMDLYLFAVHLPHKHFGDPYRELMRSLAQDISKWLQKYPDVLDRVPIYRRSLFWALVHGTDTDVNEEIGLRLDLHQQYAFLQGGKIAGDCVPKIAGFPADLLRARAADVPVLAEVQSVRWINEDTVELQIRASMKGVNSQDAEFQFYGVHDHALIETDPLDRLTGTSLLHARRTSHSANNAVLQDPWHDHTNDSYLVEVDLRGLEHLRIGVRAAWGEFKSFGFAKYAGDIATGLPSPLRNDHRWLVQPQRGVGGMNWRLIKRSIKPDDFLLTSWQARKTSVFGEVRTVSLQDSTVQFRQPFRPLGYRALLGWARKDAVAIGGRRVHSAQPLERQFGTGQGTVVRTAADGSAVIDRKAVRVEVDAARNEGSSLILEGRCSAPAVKPTIWLSSSNQAVKAETIWDGCKFTARFELAVLRGKSYFLRWSLVPQNRLSRAAVEPGDLNANTFLEGTVRSIRIEPRSNGTTALRVLAPSEVSKATSWETYRGVPFASGPLIHGVFVESFSGKNVSDNPGAICEYLLEHHPDIPVWVSVRDENVEVPAGAVPVITGSDDWYDKLTRAKVIVGNDNFPLWMRKQPGQYWLQTWHGWPIKRLLFDAHPFFVGLTYRRLMERQSDDWDLLLAQSAEAGELIADSAHYRGEILVGEYPRNIYLARGLRNIDAIKESLGIPEDKKVILWAPTWRYSRDDLAFPAARIARRNDAVVLIRGHHMRAIAGRGKNVINVSGYPRVEDLMAIADVLISDYSSVFFDYKLTGRPSIVYAPDLKRYKEQERGFYADWPYDSGRPVALTPHDLEEVLRKTLGTERSEEVDLVAFQRSVDSALKQIAEWIIERI